MGHSAVTIVDIAKALGISKTAVSSSLHGGGRVSEDTRAKVLAQAEQMGYVSNRAAQRLRGGKHHAVGLHIPSAVRELAFYMEFTFGAAAAAANFGLDFLLLSDNVSASRRRPAIDGLLAIDPTPESFPAVLTHTSENLPIVAVGDYEGPGVERITGWITADHQQLVQDLLDHLADAGSERPALIALPHDHEPLWAMHIIEGYHQWCRSRKVKPLLHRLPVQPSDEQLQQTVAELNASPADAAVWVAQGLAVRARTFESHQGHPMLHATMAVEEHLTGMLGVDLHAREYGRRATQILIQSIEGSVARGERVIHPAEVVNGNAR